MQLRCQACGAIQPVTSPDEADEDDRARSIRRAFRAEHTQRCGEGAVKFETATVAAPALDEGAWDRYLTLHANPPGGVTLNSADGFFYGPDGQRYCEDCWTPIPRYVDFPLGLTSPESDGAPGYAAKVRVTSVEGKAGLEHLRKAVCLPCYFEAFQRVYPGAALPDLRSLTFELVL